MRVLYFGLVAVLICFNSNATTMKENCDASECYTYGDGKNDYYLLTCVCKSGQVKSSEPTWEDAFDSCMKNCSRHTPNVTQCHYECKRVIDFDCKQDGVCYKKKAGAENE